MKKVLLLSGLIMTAFCCSVFASESSSDSDEGVAPMRSMRRMMAQMADPSALMGMAPEEMDAHLKRMETMAKAASLYESVGSKTRMTKNEEKLTKIQVKSEKAKLKRMEREEREAAAFSRQERKVALLTAEADLGIKLQTHAMDLDKRALEAQREAHKLHREMESETKGIFAKAKGFLVGKDEAPIPDFPGRAAQRVGMLQDNVANGMRRAALEGGRGRLTIVDVAGGSDEDLPE